MSKVKNIENVCEKYHKRIYDLKKNEKGKARHNGECGHSCWNVRGMSKNPDGYCIYFKWGIVSSNFEKKEEKNEDLT